MKPPRPYRFLDASSQHFFHFVDGSTVQQAFLGFQKHSSSPTFWFPPGRWWLRGENRNPRHSSFSFSKSLEPSASCEIGMNQIEGLTEFGWNVEILAAANCVFLGDDLSEYLDGFWGDQLNNVVSEISEHWTVTQRFQILSSSIFMKGVSHHRSKLNGDRRMYWNVLDT